MSIPLAVLIVEDTESDAQLIIRALKKAGYEITFEQVETAAQMRAALKKQTWDIVISDYSLPQFNGPAALRLLQETGLDSPFIAVSGTIGEETAVDMMKAGAHDYLMKGNLARLVPAVERELAQAEERRARQRAEEAVELSNKRFKALIENSADAITLLDANGIAIYDSPAAPGMLGYKPDELIGQIVFTLMHPDDLPKTQDLFQNLLKTPGARANATFRWRHKNGTWLWLEAVATNLLAEPSVKGIVVNYRDISERKRAEVAIKESKETFQQLFDSNPDAIVITNREGLVERVNTRVRSLFGYSGDELIAQPVEVLLPQRFRQRHLGHPAGYMADPHPRPMGIGLDLYGKRKDGSEFPIDILLSPLQTKEGTLAISIIRDITERKQADTILRTSEERFRSILDNIEDGYYEVDTAGNFTFLNPALVRMLGRPENELMGINNRLYMTPEGAKAVFQTYNRVYRTGIPEQAFDWEVVRPDGTRRSVEVSVSLIKAADGSIHGFRGIVRDVTERKRAEEALGKAEEKYRSIFENSVEGIYQTTPQGQYLAANPALARMFGYNSPEELLAGSTDLNRQFYVEIGRRDEFRRLLEENQTITDFESEIYCKDGSTLWISESARAIHDDHGTLLYYEGITEDVTKRKQAEERIQRQLEHLTALTLIDQAISASFDLQIILNILLEQVTIQLRVDAAIVLLHKPHLHTLEFTAGHGFRGRGLTKLSLRLGQNYAGKAALERRLISIPDITQAEPFSNSYLTTEEGFVAYYAVPLISKGQVMGVLEVFHRARLDPDEEWLNFLQTLAGQAAIAIDNADLFNRLHRSNAELTRAYDATIEGWSRALDLRDKETEGHSLRVTEISLRLAQTMGQSDEELVHIRRGGLLHDIGKLGVPDNILLKPEPLTDEEWGLMKRHPQYAYDMLAPINYLRRALDIPYCHHEKWDGTGYPRGLKGEEIPVAARIFAVVDVWDALRSDRPYRAGWSDEKVREHIRQQSGKHFDPQVVETFLKLSIFN